MILPGSRFRFEGFFLVHFPPGTNRSTSRRSQTILAHSKPGVPYGTRSPSEGFFKDAPAGDYSIYIHQVHELCSGYKASGIRYEFKCAGFRDSGLGDGSFVFGD